MISEIVLGPITIHLYGLIIGIAITAGWWWAKLQATKAGISPEFFDKIALSGVISGLLGARIYHVIDYWTYYQSQPGQIVAVWQGGLGIFGAVIGGALGILAAIYLIDRKSQNKVPVLLDAAAWALPLSQGIGRWGNWINGELFGGPTNNFWGIYVAETNRPKEWMEYSYFHPLFFYESGLNLVLFGLMIWVSRNSSWRLGLGKYLSLYLFGYGLIRLLLEPMRLNPWRLAGIPTAQLLAMISMVIGVVLFIRSLKKDEKN